MAVYLRSIGNYRWGPTVKLTLSDAANAEVDSRDIPEIRQFVGYTITLSDYSTHIDETQPDGWTQFGTNSKYRFGFFEAPETIISVQEGETVPIGRYETLAIIHQRNRILRDSGINLTEPFSTATLTEGECVDNLIAQANVTPGNGYQYYFPAASAAHAFEPKVAANETLSPKFKSHRWFLPTAEDLIHLHILISGNETFAKKKVKDIMRLNVSAGCTDEHRRQASDTMPIYTHIINLATGSEIGWQQSDKSYMFAVVPFVEF